jgi:ABC-type phosphate transport system substrate-binding protein
MKIMLSVAIWSLVGFCAVQAQVIVANTNVKVAEISKSDLVDLFTGASSDFNDGQHAVPITLKSGAVHEAFLDKYIGKNDKLFRAAWIRLVFAGRATMPQAFDNEEALIQHVASTPGAIGYVSTLPDNPKVKSLLVK